MRSGVEQRSFAHFVWLSEEYLCLLVTWDVKQQTTHTIRNHTSTDFVVSRSESEVLIFSGVSSFRHATCLSKYRTHFLPEILVSRSAIRRFKTNHTDFGPGSTSKFRTEPLGQFRTGVVVAFCVFLFVLQAVTPYVCFANGPTYPLCLNIQRIRVSLHMIVEFHLKFGHSKFKDARRTEPNEDGPGRIRARS